MCVVTLCLCQNESSWETIHVKMYSTYRFILKGFERTLVLKQRPKVTRKWTFVAKGLFSRRNCGQSFLEATLAQQSTHCFF